MAINITHAIILAAGLGKRMQPLTLTRPKPLVEVQGKALIDYNIDWLTAAGITNIIVNTSYMADMLEQHLMHRTHATIRISREEPQPLETGGGIFKALPLLGDAPFISMNSDAIFPEKMQNTLTRMAQCWNDDTMDFMMLLVPQNRAHGLHGKADFIRSNDGLVRRPEAGEEADFIFTGVQIIHPRVFEGCESGAFSISRLWEKSKQNDGSYARVSSVVLDGDWLHVGDLKGLEEAETYLKAILPQAAQPALG